MTEYTTEFYLLVARCDLGETEEQLVSRYIGGLRIEFQDTLNLLDPFTVAEAQQRALQLEKQIIRKTNRGGTWSPSSSSNRGGVSNSAPNRVPVPQVQNVKPHQSEPQTKTQDVGVGRTGTRCFKCGESGHRMADCKKESKVGKGLFIENEENSFQEYVDFTQAPVYDDYGGNEDVNEEFVKGDEGPLLVVQRTCFTPREVEGSDGWLRNNIFQSTCTIGGKVCRLVIDPGSCENVISDEAVVKLSLETHQHPHPYKLSWLQKANDVKVSKRALVPFSIGTSYRDKVWCDVVPMDACHILLGRP